MGLIEKGRLAFTHPGKIGDSLYVMPAMRWICNHRKTPCDFYTSKYCEPLKRLFEHQSFIDNFFMPDNYAVERMDLGVQPWYIPVDINLYDTVWQLGYRQVPDRPLPNYIAMLAGIQAHNGIEVKYEYPDFETLDEPYICVAPRGKTTYAGLFQEIIEKSPIKVIQVGGWGDAVEGNAIDKTGLDMLETTTWLAKSVGFVGIMSAMLVLANGFDFPKVSPHDSIHWDMRHVVRSENNFYPINPTVEEVLECLKLS